MTYEVVVVGGGVGGLTTAALLAARGVSVCLLERESRPGGCAATFQKFGYSFEAGAGLYGLWQPGEIHDRIFAELPVDPPEVRPLEPAYMVRLPGGEEIAITRDSKDFEDRLRAVFPECADEAVEFYRGLAPLNEVLLTALRTVPALHTAGRVKQLVAILSRPGVGLQLMKARKDTALHHLEGTSWRFRRFIDAQLQLFTQSPSEQCSYLQAAVALMQPRTGMFAIRGGASTLAERLAESVKKSGGTVRLDSPVLRLAYDSSGRAVGVDLLSGETVAASRAIVSNMTIWDTYGKLVGLNRTPLEIRKRLNNFRGWGAYLLYLGLDEEVARNLRANQILALTDWQEGQDYNPETSQLMFACSPDWDTRGPGGKRAVTVQMFTDVDQWFTFHRDESEYEEQDQAILEALWQRLHTAMPELGAAVEVIDSANPRTYYDLTRRKLGMVGAVGQSTDIFGRPSLGHLTSLPNLFMVGDTVFPGAGLAAVSQSALIVANEIAGSR
jgi:C-3',4' desaturase CrtD